MTTSAASSTNPIQPVPNPTGGDSALKHVITGAKDTNVFFRLLQLGDRFPKVINQSLALAGKPPLAPLQHCSNTFGPASNLMSALRIPSTFKSAYYSVKKLFTGKDETGKAASSEESTRTAVKAVHDVGDAVAMASYTGAVVTAAFPALSTVGTALVQTGSAADAVADGTDVGMLAEDLTLIAKAEKNPNNSAEVKQNLADDKSLKRGKLLKVVLAVISFILSTTILVFGGPIIPVIIFGVTGLVITALALRNIFFEQTRAYKPIEYSALKQASVLVPAQA